MRPRTAARSSAAHHDAGRVGRSATRGHEMPAPRCKPGPHSRTMRRPVDNEALWERHAGWWQREFSAGADPEYEEQILPLVARHLRGARRVLDVGCGEGQVARRIAGLGARGRRPRSDAVAGQRRPGPRRWTRVRAGARGGAAVPQRCVRRGACCASRSSTSTRSRPRSTRWRGCSSRVAGSCCCSCHPLLQAPGSGWIDDRILGEHYWRIGAYLRRRHRRRQGRARRRPAVHPSPAQPLRPRDGRSRPARSTTWRSRHLAGTVLADDLGLRRGRHDPTGAPPARPASGVGRAPASAGKERADEECRDADGGNAQREREEIAGSGDRAARGPVGRGAWSATRPGPRSPHRAPG